MEFQEALSQIECIRRQLSRTEVFRGYRAATVAASAVLGCLAAAGQNILAPDPAGSDLDTYLMLWAGVAVASLAAVTLELSLRWRRCGAAHKRRQIVLAAEQFLPCVAAGAAVTWTIPQYLPSCAPLLPGLWAMLFSLGVFASLGQLPGAIRLVAAHYMLSGAACLVWAQGAYALSPWAMVSTFGVGQSMMALVLYWSLERPEQDQSPSQPI